MSAVERHDVLLVEDDYDTQEATSEVLRALGCSVYVAANGRLALAYLAAHAPPGLILLDLMMPEMNGWEFRVAQLADPRLASIPVVLVSAGPGLDEQARLLGMELVVRKPVELSALADAVLRHLRVPRAASSVGA
jgi:CheY-like chemotaxis protein